MLINNEEHKIANVIANYGYFIDIISNDEYKFTLSFKLEHDDLKTIELNKRLNVTEQFDFDASLSDKDGYQVIDIYRDNVYITRIEDNLFRLEVIINDAVIMFNKSKTDLKTLNIDTQFSFNYDYEPTPDYDILKRGNKIHTQEELNEVLDKM